MPHGAAPEATGSHLTAAQSDVNQYAPV